MSAAMINRPTPPSKPRPSNQRQHVAGSADSELPAVENDSQPLALVIELLQLVVENESQPPASQPPETEGQPPESDGQPPESEGQLPESEGQPPETESQPPHSVESVGPPSYESTDDHGKRGDLPALHESADLNTYAHSINNNAPRR